MKRLPEVVAALCLWLFTALPAVAVDLLYPVKHPIKAAWNCTYPVRHPLKTGKWMDESGFNGGAQGIGATGQIVFTVRSFFIR
jgi:hypothetical protein